MIPKFEMQMDKVVANFKKSIDLTKNLKPLMQKILGDEESNLPWTMRGSVIKSFKDQVSPDSKENWQPLSPAYAKRKAKEYPGMPTLVATGTLFNSLARKNSGSVGPFYPSDTSMQWGTSVPYAKYHQSTSPRHTLNRRAFMAITKDQVKAWNVLLKQYAKDAMTGVDPLAGNK